MRIVRDSFLVLALLAARAVPAQGPPPGPPTFPAQQRAPGDPALVDRGRQLYEINCRACHGADLRGGDMGGPNLLRSPLVLNDQAGEAIGPVVTNGRVPAGGGRPMPPLPLPADDLKAVATYVHSVVRMGQPQGAPPPGAKPELNLLVGNARKGRAYFDANCTSCHSATGQSAIGDLAGIGARLTDIETLQNSWVSGRRMGAPAATAPRSAQVKVTLKNGQTASGSLERLDDFFVSLRTSDGALRSFSRTGAGADAATVEVDDPMAGHRRFWTKLTNDDMHNVTAYLATLK